MNNKLFIFITVLTVVVVGLYSADHMSKNVEVATTTPAIRSTSYVNNEYGFRVSLPQDWNGYSVVTNTWEGNAIGSTGEIPKEHGPLILIRNPKWTKENPYQDIPVMVFTINQWNDMQADKFHIGAAPINPSELGRNAKYVFALPARYNYAFPAGYEEVDQIIQNHPLKAF